MTPHHYLAVDLGAESGRVILGSLSADRIDLEELHRFPNTPVRLPTGLYWDTLRLFHEIKHGLTVAGRQRQLAPEGIGVDTWGVDFALLGADGSLVEVPRHYRDERNHGVMDKVCGLVPAAEIFDYTGIQFMEINSLYQWYGMKLAQSPALNTAKQLLFKPDLLNYWLTGVARAEETIASTSQFYNPRVRHWATELLHRLELPSQLLPELVPPGTALGPLLPYLADETGLMQTTVYASAGHDTAAAVAAVPAEGQDWCYISSGTWSLMGVETTAPIINKQSLAMNFTNEMGVEGRVRVLKNIAGLWVLQECRRAWALNGRDYSYEELVRLAGGARPFAAILAPDAFLKPGRMPEQIAEFCLRTGQPALTDPGEITRAILESLALSYRRVLESLEHLRGRALEVIHIVGGGSRNQLLNQFTADATNRVVVAGPSEATALGNVCVQAMGAGRLSGLDAARQLLRRSCPVNRVEPQQAASWQAAYVRFQEILSTQTAA